MSRKTLLVGVGLVAAAMAYYGYRRTRPAPQVTRYILAAASRGSLIVSVSGTGQVTTARQVDVRARASGDALAVPVKGGQLVHAGEVLAQLDARDAIRSVRDAKSALESAKLALEKLKQPVDQLTVLQMEHALAQANETKARAIEDLRKAYEDAFNATANAFLDLPTIMSGLNDTLLGSAASGTGQWNIDFYADTVRAYDDRATQYRSDASNAYQSARKKYDSNLASYKSTSRFSPTETMVSLLDETYETTRSVSEAVKNATNVIQFYKDKLIERSLVPKAIADTHLAGLSGYTAKTNSHLSNLLTIKRTIQVNQEAIVNADRSIAEKTESLVELRAGPHALDIRSQELAVTQRTNAFRDAEEKLADYTIRAPVDGVVASVSVQRGDPVSSNAIIATIVAQQRTATVSLNEVDVAAVNIGQHTTLTFDAIPGLQLTGVVAEIDTLGTVTQGVVTYAVSIILDTQDDHVRPGMSVAAVIITAAKTDVIVIPGAAVKSTGAASYVEVPAKGAVDASMIRDASGVPLEVPPERRSITVGLSNASTSEVIDGLSEGEIVVVRTVASSVPGASSPQRSIFPIGGGGGRAFGGGGGPRG